jgi:hypothetical protein
MIQSLLVAIGGIVGLMLVWVLIQLLWKKTFKAYLSDEDVLADRSSCANCTCTTICENKRTALLK